MNRGQAIRALRHRLLETQVEFADTVGVRRATISIWENGGEVSIRHARRLVELGLDPAYVLPTMPVAAGAGQDLSRRTA